MKNSERYQFSDFTRKNYRLLLRLAKRHYVFRSYADFRKNEKFVLWRHDVDFSPDSAVALAGIEADEGVCATYTFLLHSEFYNLLDRGSTECVRKIISMGHAVGLHFDADYYGTRDVESMEKQLTWEKKILERTFGRDVSVFSFHNPAPETMEHSALRYAGMVNAYSASFRKHVGYCSDSNGYWRHRRLAGVLREAKDPCLQVLTHPVWWAASVMSPKERVDSCIGGRDRVMKSRYDEMLRATKRKNIDW